MSPKEQENPLHNILINVLIPVFALSAMSKDGDKLWHIGATNAMIVALVPPLAYGIWFFLKTKKANFFSLLGLVSVALTGGLTIYLWNQDGTVKPNAALLFGIKEACIPFVLGFAVLFSHRTKSPLMQAFLYNDSVFNIPLIEQTVAEKSAQEPYAKLLWQSTLLFACSFGVSTVLNLVLAMHFLGDLDHQAENARELYNDSIAKITWWGFLFIGLPLLIFLGFTLWRLVSGLKRLTGLDQEKILLPR
jgi:ABC-type Na+ efflux pump permease subunit